MESSTYSHVTDWDDVIKKEARGINDADLGEVQEVNENYVVTERGTINKEKFYLPKSLPHGYNGSILLFNITEEEAKEKYLGDNHRLSSSTDKSGMSGVAHANENSIQVIEERLDVSKKETIQEARVVKKPLTETKAVDIELTHEELIIEKRPAANKYETSMSSSSSNSSSILQPTPSKTEITIPLKKEEAKVSKKPYIKEEIVIKKKSVTETKTVNEQLKSEKVSVVGPNGEVIEAKEKEE